MSTLKVVSIQHPSSSSVNAGTDSSGNFLMNSGLGSSYTAYGCRAWVNFNGTGAVAIRSSGGVTTIGDNGTGDYTVNFTAALTAALPDDNYEVNFGSVSFNTGNFTCYASIKGAAATGATLKSTSQLQVTYGGSTTLQDCAEMHVSIFR